jgi:flagellar assembly protein FliH
MTGARKFTFDEEFAADGRSRTVRKAEEQARLAAAEADGHSRGRIEGRLEAEQEASMRLAQAAERIAATAAAVLQRLDAEAERLEREAAVLALAFARKLAGDVTARAPLAALEEAAADCFRQLVGVPHVVVRIDETMVDRTKTILDRMARERGYEGRLVVLGQPGMASGDFTIEWADGGIVRDGQALSSLIGDAIERRYPGATAGLSH